MIYWNDSQAVASWEQPGYETVQKIYHPHPQTSQLYQVSFCDITSWCQAHIAPSQGCKRAFKRCPVDLQWRWNTAPLLTMHCLGTGILYLPSVSVFWSLFPNCWIAFSSVFPNHFFISYFVNFALTHSKSLSTSRDSITTAISWSLLNHMLNFPCTLRQCDISEN